MRFFYQHKAYSGYEHFEAKNVIISYLPFCCTSKCRCYPNKRRHWDWHWHWDNDIGKYSTIHGASTAVRKFKRSHPQLSESTARSLQKKYEELVKSKSNKTALPKMKRGRPLIVGFTRRKSKKLSYDFTMERRSCKRACFHRCCTSTAQEKCRRAFKIYRSNFISMDSESFSKDGICQTHAYNRQTGNPWSSCNESQVALSEPNCLSGGGK